MRDLEEGGWKVGGKINILIRIPAGKQISTLAPRKVIVSTLQSIPTTPGVQVVFDDVFNKSVSSLAASVHITRLCFGFKFDQPVGVPPLLSHSPHFWLWIQSTNRHLPSLSPPPRLWRLVQPRSFTPPALSHSAYIWELFQLSN